ncbi:hypothetical protein BKA01_004896 [Pseudonocardia eucalypti]|uniref:hypothetical protein n=1 Tax=Pseudonocardia eucalypti TaxID=648755 RepID=UPI00161DE87D|nr:hypothetical protein [Pseudonocardia eucalypti]
MRILKSARRRFGDGPRSWAGQGRDLGATSAPNTLRVVAETATDEQAQAMFEGLRQRTRDLPRRPQTAISPGMPRQGDARK